MFGLLNILSGRVDRLYPTRCTPLDQTSQHLVNGVVDVVGPWRCGIGVCRRSSEMLRRSGGSCTGMNLRRNSRLRVVTLPEPLKCMAY